MAKKKSIDLITEEQEKQLQDMVNNMLEIASNVVEEYKNLDLSELSGSLENIIQVHESSPFLDEVFKGEQWKKVIKNIPTMPKTNPDIDDSE